MSSSSDDQRKPSEIKMDKPKAQRNNQSRTDQDITGNEEAEL